METRKFISLAEKTFRIGFAINSILIVVLVLLFVHSLYSPDSNKSFVVSVRSSNSYYNLNLPPVTTFAEWKKLNEPQVNFLYYNKLDIKSKFIIFFSVLIPLMLLLLIVKELINFVGSITNYSIFFACNSFLFKRLGIYFGILIFLVLVFSFLKSNLVMVFQEGLVNNTIKNFGFFLDLGYIFFLFLFMMMSFVFSFVFKEGERLRVENELTI